MQKVKLDDWKSFENSLKICLNLILKHGYYLINKLVPSIFVENWKR